MFKNRHESSLQIQIVPGIKRSNQLNNNYGILHVILYKIAALNTFPKEHNEQQKYSQQSTDYMNVNYLNGFTTSMEPL